MLKLFKTRRTKKAGPLGLAAEVGLPQAYARDFVATGAIRQARAPLFDDGTPIVAMGSCFANEVSAYLIRNEIGEIGPRLPEDAHPLFHEHSKEVSSWGDWDGRSNLQYYNTFSLRQEFEKAAGLWTQPDDDYWDVRIRDTPLVQCPYRRRIFCRTADDLRTLTARIDAAIEQALTRAKLAIITLGLIEVWEKKNDGRIACCQPGYCGGGGEDTTRLVVADYEQNYANTDALIRLATGHFGIEHVVISVSPVGLGRTYRDVDISIANMESKCMLRAVAGRVAEENDNVTYFPSYELCMLDHSAFRDDGRHVRQEKIDQIMGFFVDCHGSR